MTDPQLSNNQAPLLVLVGGPQAGVGIPLGDTVVIGRGPECDLRTESWISSRRHAVIRRAGEVFELEDLSKNGTLLNGERVTVPVELRDNDVITLPGLRLLFHSSAETVTLERVLGSPPEEAPAALAFELDAKHGAVLVGGTRVRLSPRELRAIQLIYVRRGQVVHKNELADHVWADARGDVTDTAIEQLIARLRRKIELDPPHPRFVVTVRGYGYRFGQA